MNKEDYRKTFSVGPGTVLKIYNKSGNVVVSSWNRDCVEIEAIKESHWWSNFLKEPDIDVTTGNEFVIRTLYSNVLSKAIPVHYRITLPKGVLISQVETSTGKINVDKVSGDVEAKTSTGEIQIHEVNGFVKAITSNGKISADKVSGNAEAKTLTGEIQIHEVSGFVKAITSNGKISADKVSGNVEAKTLTGEIQIHEVNGFVEAVTKNGKIDITEVGGLYGAYTDTGAIVVEVPAFRDNLEIRSRTGSITALLSPDIVAQLEASTSYGKITYIELPVTVSEVSKTKLTARLGEGSGRINIKSSTGSITLKKLGRSSLNSLK